jgi:hypothetical protein
MTAFAALDRFHDGSASDTPAFIFQREQFPCLIHNARFEQEFLFYFSQGLR